MKNRLALVLQRLLLRTDGLGAQAQAQWTLMSFALRVERERGIAAASAPPTPAIARLVDGNAINPGLQVSVAAKAINALEDAQESLLRQVARFLGIFRQPIEQGEKQQDSPRLSRAVGRATPPSPPPPQIFPINCDSTVGRASVEGAAATC